VAKILVADDNSNIQKMVGLALKDQGIDVVAVGNGEAAVRKISDVRPDLVLADVFMPVRNGYEVCKYVKGDSSLSHIPVILLVGAFDPLDEEEAQRVGADGVLKKPFVPPDPLISMVKSALVRASTGQLNVPKASNNNEGSSPTVTSLPGADTLAAIPTQAVPAVEPAEEPVTSRPAEVKIEPGTQAPTFGSLLEPAPTETGDYTNFTTPNRELLERDWGANQEEEEEEEEESSAGWRPDGGSEPDAGDPAGKKSEKKKREAWTPTREKQQNLLETDEPEFVSPPVPAKPATTKPSVPAAPPVAAAPPSAPPGVSSTPMSVKPPTGKPAAPVAAPPTPVAVKPPAAGPKTAAPVMPKPWVEMPPDKPLQPAAPPAQAATPPAKQVAPASKPGAPSAPGTPVAPKEGEKAPGGESWFSVSSTPWGTDPKHPGQGAPSWDTSTPAAGPPAKAPVQPTAPANAAGKSEFVAPGAPALPDLEAEPEATGFYTESETLPELVSGGENVSPAIVERLRQEATQAVEESTLQQVVEEASPEYTLPTPEAAAPQASPDTDALVAKVLAKLSPEVLQAVTREILKPVVEAMVRDEIKAKKS
jgi:CheY-like chemotaxis protein